VGRNQRSKRGFLPPLWRRTHWTLVPVLLVIVSGLSACLPSGGQQSGTSAVTRHRSEHGFPLISGGER
jgi:hypothetical protein